MADDQAAITLIPAGRLNHRDDLIRITRADLRTEGAEVGRARNRQSPSVPQRRPRAEAYEKLDELEACLGTPEATMHADLAELYADLAHLNVGPDGVGVPDRYVAREELPSSGAIMHSLGGGIEPESYDAERAERYARREGFY